jgi:hypothetical protein
VINLGASLCTAVAVLAWPACLAAQRVLDLPMRSRPGADALAAGAIAVFWNPGAIGVPAGRGEVVVLDVRGPPATSLDGLGVAGAIRLDERTSLGAGYQHIGIDDIEQTDDSPLPSDGTAALDISEHVLSLALVRMLGETLAVGAGAQYTQTADIVSDDDVVALTAGFHATASLPAALLATVAAGARVEETGTDWFAGAAAERMLGPAGEWLASVEYGVTGSGRYRGVAHRAALGGGWREYVRMAAGVAGEPGAEGHTWKPVLGLGLRFSRYGLGVLREDMPNDLGAVYSFHLGVTF